MRLFIDTNVILDVLTDREPQFRNPELTPCHLGESGLRIEAAHTP